MRFIRRLLDEAIICRAAMYVAQATASYMAPESGAMAVATFVKTLRAELAKG